MRQAPQNIVLRGILALGAGCSLDTSGLGSSSISSTSADSTGPVTPSSTGLADSTSGGTTTTGQGSTSSSAASTSTSSGSSSSSSDDGDSSSSSSSSEGSTGEPSLVVAGELIVDLDAEDPSAGDAVWTNAGTGGDFLRQGAPATVMVDGHVGIEFFADGRLSIYESEQNAPASVTGPDPTRTIEVWAWNDELVNEETMVAWGRRGGPGGSNMSFNFSDNPDYGAVGHWDDADLGWSTLPTSGDWHHLVYTYDGTTTRVYVDGVLDNSEELGAGAVDTHPDHPFVLGAQTGSGGTYERRGSLVLARIRVHREVLDADDVAHNYALEQGEF